MSAKRQNDAESLSLEDFKQGMAKLWTAFPSRGTDTERRAFISLLWEEVSEKDWLDRDIWNAAIAFLVRNTEYMPTVKALLDACAEASRRRESRRVGTTATVQNPRETNLLPWMTDIDAAAGEISSLQKSIQSGVFDRSYARGAVSMRKRREFADAVRKRIIAAYPGDTKKDKFLPILLSGREVERYDSTPSDEEINIYLEEMSKKPAKRIGGLFGTLEAAMSASLPPFSMYPPEPEEPEGEQYRHEGHQF